MCCYRAAYHIVALRNANKRWFFSCSSLRAGRKQAGDGGQRQEGQEGRGGEEGQEEVRGCSWRLDLVRYEQLQGQVILGYVQPGTVVRGSKEDNAGSGCLSRALCVGGEKQGMTNRQATPWPGCGSSLPASMYKSAWSIWYRYRVGACRDTSEEGGIVLGGRTYLGIVITSSVSALCARAPNGILGTVPRNGVA